MPSFYFHSPLTETLQLHSVNYGIVVVEDFRHNSLKKSVYRNSSVVVQCCSVVILGGVVVAVAVFVPAKSGLLPLVSIVVLVVGSVNLDGVALSSAKEGDQGGLGSRGWGHGPGSS